MTENTDASNIEYSFGSGGVFHRLLTKLGFSKSGLTGAELRVAGVILLTYVPILLLAFIQGVAWSPDLKLPFVFDVTETCRFLLVGPMLIACDAFVDPWIVQAVRYARDQLIPQEKLDRFNHLMKRAVHWRDSLIIECSFLVAVFGWQLVETRITQQAADSTWHQLPSTGEPTYAFLWCIYFAKPLIRFLWLRWLWRYLVWSLFLMRMAAMPLKIVPTHPDRHGGLGIIAVGHAQFAPLAMTFGAQAASILGQQILFDGKTLVSFKYEILGIVVIVLIFFLSPLLAFSRQLLTAKRTGLFKYGVLADQVTSAFDDRWTGDAEGNEKLLGTGEVQSLSALANSYQVVRTMKISLLGRDNIMFFAGATLLPFVPLLVISYPFDELVKHVLKTMI